MNLDINLIGPQEHDSCSNLESSPGQLAQTNPAFTVFLISGALKRQTDVEFNENLTVESLMHRLFNENRDFFKNRSVYDLDFYIANKRGEPKDDYPGELTSDRQVAADGAD